MSRERMGKMENDERVRNVTLVGWVVPSYA